MKTWFSICFLLMGSLASQEGQWPSVRLLEVDLNMQELVAESARQTSMDIRVKMDFPAGPRVRYDCISTLPQIIKAIKGYVKLHTGVSLVDQWKASSVLLVPPARQTLVTAVEPEEDDAVSKGRSGPSFGFLKKMWGSWPKASGNGNKRNSGSASSQTKIKKMVIDTHEETKDVMGADVDEVPSRLKVETVPRQNSEALDLFPDLAEPLQKESKPHSVPTSAQSDPIEPKALGDMPELFEAPVVASSSASVLKEDGKSSAPANSLVPSKGPALLDELLVTEDFEVESPQPGSNELEPLMDIESPKDDDMSQTKAAFKSMMDEQVVPMEESMEQTQTDALPDL